MKKISKFLSCILLLEGIMAAITFANAQDISGKTITPPGLEAEGRACIQVIAPAISPAGICKEFPTPCDVPEGWRKVEQCPKDNIISPTVPPDITPPSMPIMPIIGDNIETDLKQELSIREIRGRIICKELNRCPLSESKSSTEVSIKSAKITEIGTDYLKISVFGYVYKANINNAKILRASETTLNVKELSIGDIVNITGSLDPIDNYLINAAIVKNVSISKKQDIFTGTIASVTPPDTFVLNINSGPVPVAGSRTTAGLSTATADVNSTISTGKNLTVAVNTSTKIIKTGTPRFCKNAPCPLMMRPDIIETQGSFNDLKTGMPVTVRGTLNKTSLKIEAQLIILKGFKATETNGEKASEEIKKPEKEIIKPQKTEETAVTNEIGTNIQTLPAPKPNIWDKIRSFFGR